MKNDIKFLRRSKGFDLTQKELAEKTGVSHMTIVHIENGGSPNLETAYKISRFFKLPLEQIFFD
jgi:putative transcriptional regulator